MLTDSHLRKCATYLLMLHPPSTEDDLDTANDYADRHLRIPVPTTYGSNVAGLWCSVWEDCRWRAVSRAGVWSVVGCDTPAEIYALVHGRNVDRDGVIA